jgi:hypothetical protein
MTGAGRLSATGNDFIVALPPPAQEEIISEATAMKNRAENPDQLRRFIIVQCHSKHLGDDSVGLGTIRAAFDRFSEDVNTSAFRHCHLTSFALSLKPV